MNIINYLLTNFFYEEKWNMIFMIITSFVINVLQTNGISFISAKIIDFTQKNNKKNAIHFFQYFVMLCIVFIIVYSFYKYFQNKLLR